MNSYRLALLYFRLTGHNKYAFTVLKLLHQIRLLPKSAFKHSIWGRFINTSGVKGRNISQDLHLEHLNLFLKELLKNLRSNFDEDNAGRIACSLRNIKLIIENFERCLLYTSPSPRDATLSRMPSSA